MKALGLAFDVAVSDVELTLPPGEDPCDPVPVAVAKVVDVARAASNSAQVLGADTIVVDGTRPIGKPVDAEDAVTMLMGLRGRTHRVRTGVALYERGRLVTFEVASPVQMRDYDRDVVERYVATGQALDCAGSYDARSAGELLIAGIDGCMSAVIGFPVGAVVSVLRHETGHTGLTDAIPACEVLCGTPCRARNAATAKACDASRFTRRTFFA